MMPKSFTALALILSVGCAQKKEAADSVDSVEAANEAGIVALSGMADEQSGSGFAIYRTEPRLLKQDVLELLIPSAHANSLCSRAALQTCTAGSRSIDYSGCSIGASQFSIRGEVDLSYSDTSCSMSTTGNSVTRSYDFTIAGPRGGSVTHSSAVRESVVDGTSIGGGGRLTRTAGGWDLEILGKHTIGTGRRGRTVFDVSVKTTAPVQVTGGLSRASRVLDGGQVEVHHNLAGFKAVLTPSNLQYSAMCCHPVSGSINATYSGSVAGEATLSFEGCGSATLTKDGVNSSVSLTYCE